MPGIIGKVANCQAMMFPAYVTARVDSLVDFQLYLPDSSRNALAGENIRRLFGTRVSDAGSGRG